MKNKNTKSITIVNKPPENRLGMLSNFDQVDFEGDTQYYPNESGIDNVQGYSIMVNEEASDNATIVFEENVSGTWTELVSISPTGITELTTYNGVLSVSSTSNKVRLRIEGTEHFIHKNRALWKLKYKSAHVPVYEPWVQYEMPSDFTGVDVVVEEFAERQYTKSSNYKLENFKDFYYNFYFDGEIRIIYHPVPTTITSLDDELEIDTVTAQGIVHEIVAIVGFYENPDLVNYAEGRRLEAKTDAAYDEASSIDVMTSYYE